MVVGGTDVNTGYLKRFYENATNEDIIESIMISSAVPVLFPYQEF